MKTYSMPYHYNLTKPYWISVLKYLEEKRQTLTRIQLEFHNHIQSKIEILNRMNLQWKSRK